VSTLRHTPHPFLCSSSFFFKAYGHHPDLHSFPTRRSSDLDDRCHRHNLETRQHERLLPVRAIACGQSGRMGHHSAAAGRGKGKADRKSTRLNSSHVAISYAVFCLKKKKPATTTGRRSTTHG